MVSKSFIFISAIIFGVVALTCYADDSCSSDEDEYLPNYSDCTKFYKCEDDVKIPMQCPDDFFWNQVVKACQISVDCSYLSTTVSTTPGNGCPDTGTSYLPDYLDCAKFYKCEDGEKISMDCPDGFGWVEEHLDCEEMPNCEHVTNAPTPTDITTSPSVTTVINGYTSDPSCPADGTTAYLPYPDDCAKYYECIDGEKVLLPCADGYLFDVGTASCEPEDQVDCSSTGNPTQVTASVSTVTNGYTSDPSCAVDGTTLPHPYDCSKYYECVNGEKVVLPCADGYLFSVETGDCEPESTVDCSYTSPGGSTVTSGTIITSGTGTTVAPPTAAPIDDFCKDQPDGALVRYPSDCSMFVQCRSQEGILYQCESGSTWNQNEQKCDTNNDENCSGITSGTSPGTKSTSTTSTAKPTNQPDQPTTKATISTIRDYTSDPSCPSDGVSYLPHPTDCSKYYECVNGQKVELPCADGYYFSTETNGCDLAENVDCSHTGTYHTQTTKYPNTGTTSNPGITSTNGPHTTSTPLDELCTGKEDGALLAHPTLCSEFIQCESQQAVLYQCETGEGWNDSTKKCETGITC